jgi:predicted GNAT family acetyltransferase
MGMFGFITFMASLTATSIMEIKNENDGKRGSFLIENNNKVIGKMDYMFAGPVKIVIVHTEVNEAFRGKGIGDQLVKGAVDYARKHHKKISPLCHFAKKTFETNPEYSDVLF